MKALQQLSPIDQQPVIGSGRLKSTKDNTKYYEKARKWSKERQRRLEEQ